MGESYEHRSIRQAAIEQSRSAASFEAAASEASGAPIQPQSVSSQAASQALRQSPSAASFQAAASEASGVPALSRSEASSQAASQALRQPSSAAQNQPRSAASPDAAPSTAYIALGSNMGSREDLLLQAIERIDSQSGIVVDRVSGIYETDPVGYTDQPAFLNMVIAARTSLEPLLLLRTLLDLEQQLGRIRHERWGPRTIDLDLLLYDNVRMDQEELTLPHPRMMERSFVLVPLHDVMSDSHPLHEQVAEKSAATTQAGKDGITLWKIINWRSASEPFGS